MPEPPQDCLQDVRGAFPAHQKAGGSTGLSKLIGSSSLGLLPELAGEDATMRTSPLDHRRTLTTMIAAPAEASPEPTGAEPTPARSEAVERLDRPRARAAKGGGRALPVDSGRRVNDRSSLAIRSNLAARLRCSSMPRNVTSHQPQIARISILRNQSGLQSRPFVKKFRRAP